MNILEQLAQMANRGELAEPSKVVECANQIKLDTNDYTNDGRNTENYKEPIVVDAETIRKEMEKGYRPTRQEPMMYTNDVPFIINNIE